MRSPEDVARDLRRVGYKPTAFDLARGFPLEACGEPVEATDPAARRAATALYLIVLVVLAILALCWRAAS